MEVATGGLSPLRASIHKHNSAIMDEDAKETILCIDCLYRQEIRTARWLAAKELGEQKQVTKKLLL